MPPARAPGHQRSPTVLVTDSRDQQQQSQQRRRRSPATSSSTRFITVDNVLQYASDVPSMHQRNPPPSSSSSSSSRSPRSRLASATGGLIGAGGGSSTGASSTGSTALAGAAGTIGRLAAQPRLPPRTTKVSEKLVLLPETNETAIDDEGEGEEAGREAGEEDEDDDDVSVDEEAVQRVAKERHLDPDYLRQQVLMQRKLDGDFAVDNELAPLLAEEELLRRRRVPPEKAKSYAERLPKARRAEKLARVTAYCTAQAYKMSSVASFVKEWHSARAKLYDDCLYTAYHLPLLPGHDGYRLKSSPVIKNPGGKSMLDEEIERNEQRDHHDEFLETEEHSVGGAARKDTPDARQEQHDQETSDHHHSHHHDAQDITTAPVLTTTASQELPTTSSAASASRRSTADMFSVAEMFVFSYGVVVFWNFTERQEKDLLADLAFATSFTTRSPVSLTTMPLHEEDFETEEFHFEYSTQISRPRVYNDMITLRSSDHMIKLAISHGIAQSTKLSFFEEAMARQMAEAKDVPRRLATTGQLGMKREEVFRILGRLFKSRVEVNLSSNVLDVPNFFWESEPTLYPLYIAVREYLEIKPRIQVLNERCRVFLDLAEILSDSIADSRTSHQTWIIIVLILISIIVTTSEVFLRFGLLSSREGGVSASSLAGTIVARAVKGQAPACVCPLNPDNGSLF
ncbi:hypothetical protein ASPZODRAFT_154039 [Penicilliopsis zonata CBS 506.65]|uniref:DUF155 domain-containing protein n=1 Tax=Penicilliopsis zonata CBS 506.65 TaxID=1073090 RepID=A0A1L9SA87_9EURO|nr:hypothetical protein ASPZODRAFT_154039 [Penicilliopsis zonata CBS 506.65]OJJ44068.1 hypothetical protein ASPZODRAFT_154039 [Penicilliopsis zonata CBS 506.65]